MTHLGTFNNDAADRLFKRLKMSPASTGTTLQLENEVIDGLTRTIAQINSRSEQLTITSHEDGRWEIRRLDLTTGRATTYQVPSYLDGSKQNNGASVYSTFAQKPVPISYSDAHAVCEDARLVMHTVTKLVRPLLPVVKKPDPPTRASLLK